MPAADASDLSALRGKKILLGVSGSIAAYKSALIVRGLVRTGAEVRVLMTKAATHFISPLTLATLSKQPVVSSVHDHEGWNNHVELGLWADAYLIAPATANTLARLANGICDSVVVAVYLSARCPVFFAPAMDVDMWLHPSTRANVDRLISYGNHLIDVESGELASGLNGRGRLAEPETILEILSGHFRHGCDLDDQRLLITAGPTYEDLDPVRYLGNRSTGRMGIALAEAAAARGANVNLVLGPTELRPAEKENVHVHSVRSARQMHECALALWPDCTAAILAAAVGDYRPADYSTQKIKKGQGELMLRLLRNPDIAADLHAARQPGQRIVGFALETENGIDNARHKLRRKGMDLIVLNSPSEASGTGFGHATNQIQLVTDNKVTAFELKSKRAVAHDILDALVASARSTTLPS